MSEHQTLTCHVTIYSRSQAGDGRGGIAMAAMTPLCRFRAIRHVINYDGDVGAGSLVSHYTGISGH